MDTEAILWGVVLVLLSVIGFFVAGWMNNKDKDLSKVSTLVLAHEREIAVLKNETGTIARHIQEIKDSLREHVDKEEVFQEEIRQLMTMVVGRLGNRKRSDEAV